MEESWIRSSEREIHKYMLSTTGSGCTIRSSAPETGEMATDEAVSAPSSPHMASYIQVGIKKSFAESENCKIVHDAMSGEKNCISERTVLLPMINDVYSMEHDFTGGVSDSDSYGTAFPEDISDKKTAMSEQEDNIIEEGEQGEDVSLVTTEEEDVSEPTHQEEENGDASGGEEDEASELMDQEDVSKDMEEVAQEDEEDSSELARKEREVVEMIYEKVEGASLLEEMEKPSEDVSQPIDREKVAEDEPMDEEKKEDASELMVQEEEVEDACEQSLEEFESEAVEIEKEECAADVKEEADEKESEEIEKEEDASIELSKEEEKMESAKLEEKEEIIDSKSVGKAFKPVLKASKPVVKLKASKSGVKSSKHAVKASKPVKKANKPEKKTSKPVVKAKKLAVKTDAERDSAKLGEEAEEATSVLAQSQRKIETTNNLPSGWKRVAVLRIAGKHAGRYDTTLTSDTNVKMRSYPNVVTYLTNIGQQHLLEDKSYNFEFKQPFTPERKQTPTTTRARPSKQTTPVSSKKSEPTKVSGSGRVLMTLKRKVPVSPSDESDRKSSEWEITDSPEKPKARPLKKTTPVAKKEKTLKIAAFFPRKKAEIVVTKAAPVSKFKSVLNSIPSERKKMKETKDTCPIKDNKSHSDVEHSNDSCEQGDNVTETAEEVVCAVDARVARTESGDDDIQFEECSSEASTAFKIKSENSKCSTRKSRKRSSVDSEHSLKQPLSESDQDMSASKKAKLCKDMDLEEKSPHSAASCSVIDVPLQDKVDNNLSASSSNGNSKAAMKGPCYLKEKSGEENKNKCSPIRKRSSRNLIGGNGGSDQKKARTNGYGLPAHKTCDATWSPPGSPYNLIQERLYQDPWKLLIATIMLNYTEEKLLHKSIWKFFNKWPVAEKARKANQDDVAKVFQKAEFSQKCASRILSFTEDYLTKNWKYPKELSGIDQLGDDSYRIFCVPEWKQVVPQDGNLKKYIAWLASYEEDKLTE